MIVPLLGFECRTYSVVAVEYFHSMVEVLLLNIEHRSDTPTPPQEERNRYKTWKKIVVFHWYIMIRHLSLYVDSLYIIHGK